MFKKHDKERRSIIAISDFYDKIVFVPRTIFCDGLFDLIEAADSESIDFGEFVAAVTTYCFFEIPEVLKFCFFVFDRDKKGFITQEEMRLFVDAMHGSERRPGALLRSYAVDATRLHERRRWVVAVSISGPFTMLRSGNEMSTNVEFALDNLKYRKDGKFDFEEFKGMHHLYPSVLFPAFRSVTQCLFLNVSELQVRVDGVGATSRHRDAVDVAVRESTREPRPCRDAVVRRRLQNAMMQAMGGEQFWESKKLELSMQKEDERKREANREAREKAEAYKYREDQVRRHMGSIKYYLMPKNRAKYYEVYPLPKKYRLMEEQERANAKREKQLAEMRKKKAAQ